MAVGGRPGVAVFRPVTQEDLAPSGGKARYDANVEAIRVLHRLQDGGRAATDAEQQTLARFSSWGAIPEVFDEDKPAWTRERALLRDLLTEQQWAQARRTTINAHYTDPAYVAEVWSTLEQLGFSGGRVLEPGAGAGTFIGMAPAAAEMVGVELDETTAAIAAALYPTATIRAESFADTTLPDGYFDAAVGNVPFGEITLHDATHNRGRHTMHNHFIIKSLHLTRPGGLVAVLSSHFTLDAQDPAARREMNQLADLIGAIRLPSGAHRRAAGTEVVTDLLIFRRRESGHAPASEVWESVHARQIGDDTVRVNAYFDTRPENILGELGTTTTQYGTTALTVRADLTTTAARLRDALAGVIADARERDQLMTPRTAASAAALAAHIPAEPGLWDGTILAQPNGTFTVVHRGAQHPLTVPKSAAVELRALLMLRDGAKTLLEMEAATGEDTAELAIARQNLRTVFDRYQGRYGAINRYTLRATGRTDPETGTPGQARITPTALRILRQDPFAPVVKALELFDEETQAGLPAAILQQRVVTVRPEVHTVGTPTEAIAVSLDRTGGVHLDLVAGLLGISEVDARSALGTLVYDDPVDDRLVPAAEYLSGDIRAKLDAATAAAETDPSRYGANVPALQKALPAPLTMEEIAPRMGAVWIDADTHQQFLRDILRDSNLTVENPVPATWVVKGNRRSVLASEEWGTTRRSAIEIAAAVMEQRDLTVRDEIEVGDSTRRVVNPEETQAAQEKAEKLQERFAEWVWEDPERAAQLAAEYNRRFNSIVLRDYTEAGDYLTFPGAAATFTPRPHQRAAVARMIAEPAVGLFHEVGAGKTAEMVMGATELKRMGLITKPVIVVPNHMLEQFSREWLAIYPQAKILAASSADLTGDGRRGFIARAAANDWDAIICTRTAFERLPVSPDIEATYIQRTVDELRAAIDTADPENRMTVKQLEKKALALEEKQKTLLDRPRDPGITFESTGIDYLVVDEMHDYKNLMTPSNIQGAAIEGSAKAMDMHLKFESLRHRHGLRVGTVATATPIANSVTEAHVMQRYLRPDLLEAAGVLNFDAWAATFGQTVTEMEMAPTGGNNFRIKTRFAKFQNVPEMLKMWHVFADVKTADDLGLPTPDLTLREDGQRAPVNVVIPPTTDLQNYLRQIAWRAEQVADRKVEPKEDNMLKIATDGRKAALDMRLVGADTAQQGTKLQIVARNILSTWETSRDARYVDVTTGQPSAVPGALQIVFSDLGTPQKEAWDAYNELKQLLVAGGMPPAGIQFIHNAKTDADKGRLFAAARAGHVAVLVGSTGKMGVGTNVQARAIALHNVDCPWRPADVQQRNGRILRQGNQNPEITIYNYLVEGSFDAYMWQTVERKAKFIAQVMRGKLDVREMEDIGDFALSAAEAKALSSGNPLLLEQAKANDELQKLHRLERAHSRSQFNLSQMRASAVSRADAAAQRIADLSAALSQAVSTDGDAFRAEIRGEHFTKRADAAEAIHRWAQREYIGALPVYTERPLGELGRLGGFTIDMRATSVFGKGLMIAAELRGVPTASILIPRDVLLEASTGTVTRLENLTASLPKLIRDQKAMLVETETTVTDADARLGAPFKHATALAEAEARLADINTQLEALTDRPTTADEASPAAASADAPPLQEALDRVEAQIDARLAHEHARPALPQHDAVSPDEQFPAGPSRTVSPRL